MKEKPVPIQGPASGEPPKRKEATTYMIQSRMADLASFSWNMKPFGMNERSSVVEAEDIMLMRLHQALSEQGFLDFP